MTTMTYQRGDHVTVDHHPGVAFWVIGAETEDRVIEPDWDTLRDDHGNPMDADVWWPDESDIETVDTGRLLVRMIGDDRDIAVHPSDVHPLESDGFCPGCGQTGCGHYREE
jgi:hypothetical protein